MKYALALFLSLTCCSTLWAQKKLLIPIKQGVDDAEQADGILDLHDDEIDIGWDMGVRSTAGFVFRSVPFIKDAQISKAYLILAVEEDRTTPLTLTLALEDDVMPVGFDSVDVDSRVTVSTSVTWVVDSAFVQVPIRSVDIAPLLNAHFARNDWEPRKDVCILIAPAAQEADSVRNELEVFSFNQINSNFHPTLEIYYPDTSLIAAPSIPKPAGIDLYPNPSRGPVTIHSESGMIGRVEVFSDDGRPVSEYTVRNRTFTLPSNNVLTHGLYWVRITRDGQTQVKPLVITR